MSGVAVHISGRLIKVRGQGSTSGWGGGSMSGFFVAGSDNNQIVPAGPMQGLQKCLSITAIPSSI